MKELVSLKSSFAHSVQRVGKAGLKVAGIEHVVKKKKKEKKKRKRRKRRRGRRRTMNVLSVR